MSIFRFGEFEADEECCELRRAGHVVRVQPRVLAAIFYFLRRRGRVVTRRELIRGPWSGIQVSDAAVSRAIMLARRAISDPRATALTTVHGQGYRFVLDVSTHEVAEHAPASALATAQPAVGAAAREAIANLAMDVARLLAALDRQLGIAGITGDRSRESVFAICAAVVGLLSQLEEP